MSGHPSALRAMSNFEEVNEALPSDLSSKCYTHMLEGCNDDNKSFLNLKSQQVCKKLFPSACSALAATLFSTPFDVIRIRLQSQRNELLKSNVRSDSVKNRAIFLKTIKNEGPRKLFTGLSANVFYICPSVMLYMTTYDFLKIKLSNINSDRDLTNIALSGGIARLLAVFVGAPLELVRTLKMSKKLEYKQIGSVLRLKTKSEGIKVLFNGLIPNLYRDLPFSILYWSLYERMKSFF